MMEILGMPQGKNFSVIQINDDYTMDIGRSQAEICIPDVSVSKRHAVLKFDLALGELLLADLESHYGTSILI